MNRSAEELDKVIERLKSEISTLPQTNAFGESNDESLAELKEWVVALKRAKRGEDPENDTVAVWLDGRWSEIQDYCN